MAQLISQQFHTALCHLLKKEGRGAQSRLASQQKIDKGYLNGIIKGRKPGSETVRGQIAAYFEITYEDMLILGRQLLENKLIAEQVTPAKSGDAKGKIQDTDKNIQSAEKPEIVFLPTQTGTAETRSLRISELIKETYIDRPQNLLLEDKEKEINQETHLRKISELVALAKEEGRYSIDPLIRSIDDWLIDESTNDPDARVVFQMEFLESFPEYKKWLAQKKRTGDCQHTFPQRKSAIK